MEADDMWKSKREQQAMKLCTNSQRASMVAGAFGPGGAKWA